MCVPPGRVAAVRLKGRYRAMKLERARAAAGAGAEELMVSGCLQLI